MAHIQLRGPHGITKIRLQCSNLTLKLSPGEATGGGGPIPAPSHSASLWSKMVPNQDTLAHCLSHWLYLLQQVKHRVLGGKGREFCSCLSEALKH